MKTTIDIPEELITEVMIVTGSITKAELIQTALKKNYSKEQD